MVLNAITLRLNEDINSKLQEIKEFYAIEKDAQAIRLAINDAHRVLLSRKKEFSSKEINMKRPIDPEVAELLNKLDNLNDADRARTIKTIQAMVDG